MTEKASGLGGNGIWIAGFVVAAGVSIYALVASGVLDGGATEPTDSAEISTQSTTISDSASSSAATEPSEPTEDAAQDLAEAPASADTADVKVPAEAGPSFDLVRVDAEGNTVIAGMAGPNADLSILLDGVEIASASVDGTGKFAAILSLEPSDAPRVLSLVERRAGETDLASDATVIVAPIASVAATVADAVPDDTGTASSEETSTAAIAAPAATQTPAVILSDSEGVRVLQPAASAGGAEALPAAVSIDSISYTDTGAVMVSGRATVGLFVRLYLNNAFSAEAEVDDTGMWTSQLSDVAGGLYELRADEVDESGSVSSRVLTPFKRETPETVARARAQADAASANTQTEPAPEQSASETTAAIPAATPQPQADTGAVAASETTTSNVADATLSSAEQQAEPEPETAPSDTQATQNAATEITAPETVVEQSSGDEPEAAAQPVVVSEAAPEVPDAAPGTSSPSNTAQASADTARPAVQIITVQPGSSLWAIARDNYGEGLLYLRVFEANKEKIANPDLIYPGQVFTVPEQ